jgi:hypothetical protein
MTTLKIQVGDPNEEFGSCIIYETPVIPAKNKIAGYDLPKAKQKFVREKYPSDKNFEQLPEEEQLSILKEVLEKRRVGYWFMNNGEETYLTGLHWFYLNFWKIDVGYPEYRRSDRDYFYFWDYCVNDKLCLGMINMENRRNGKTERSNCILYEYASVNANSHVGIQSKTDADAKKVFLKLVRTWKRMPYWLRPVDEGDSQPKSALRFFEPSTRSKKGKRKEYGVSLDSWIDYETAKEEAYDGEKLKRYTMDEAGKTTIADVSERWNIIRECFVTGRTVIGKALVTTTVEEMEKKGGKNFKTLWDNSDMNVRDDNGFTRTGLYRYFKPSYYCLEGFIDEYGNPILEDAITFLTNKRNGADNKGLASEKRKYPFKVEDAFGIVYGNFWENDVKEILNHVESEIIKNPPEITYNILYERDNEIVTVPTKKNDDAVKILEKVLPDVEYKVGIDSISTDNQTGDESGSRLAVVVMKSFAGIERTSYEPVCVFSMRPDSMETAYEIVSCIIKYYGKYENIKVLCENNAGATNLLNYLINRGLKRFMQKKPKDVGASNLKTHTISDKYWIYRDNNVLEFQKGLANRFLRRYGSNIKILSLIKSLQDAGVKNADEADAFLMAIMFFTDFDKGNVKTRQTRKAYIITGYDSYGAAITKEVG